MFYVYILANRPEAPMYVGSTDDIAKRTYQHRTKAFPGFTARYNIHRLVWYELHYSREAAFRRERQIKKWNRAWKDELVRSLNPDWADLYETLGPT